MPRSPCCDGLIDDFNELRDQLRFILSQVRGMVIRHRVKDIRCETPQPWRGMGMCGGNRKALASEPMLFFELCKHSLSDFPRDATVIDSQQNNVASSPRRDEPCSSMILCRCQLRRAKLICIWQGRH